MKVVKLMSNISFILASVLIFSFAAAAQENTPKQRERIAQKTEIKPNKIETVKADDPNKETPLIEETKTGQIADATKTNNQTVPELCRYRRF